MTLLSDDPHDVVCDVTLIFCNHNWLKPLVYTVSINLTDKLCGLYFLNLLVVGEVVFECFEVVYLPFHLVQTILNMLGDFFSEALFEHNLFFNLFLDFFDACFLDAVQLIEVLLVHLNVAIVDSETGPYLA